MHDIPKIHAGNLIKTELKRQRKTTVWLAEQLGCTRMNVYKIYRRSWISTDLLIRISIILNVDFFVLISEMLNQNKSVNK
ncbi:MAG: XRE family transcriptional regulator [Bacteroidales bacterium]|nr:XRE family transcriptional regulator [Bacteroidales bacterium]